MTRRVISSSSSNNNVLFCLFFLLLTFSVVLGKNDDLPLFLARQESRELSSEIEASGTLHLELPASAAEWCSPPILPPLPYKECGKKSDSDALMISVPLYGGLTNALKMVLLGTILSFEQDVCFFVDEANSPLLERDNPNESLDSIINRYFEPIGLPATDERVVNAKRIGNVKVHDWKDVWEDLRNRRMYGQTSTIESLNYIDMEGHQLKRTMLRRMWRPLPHIREQTCNALAKHISSFSSGDGNSNNEFMSFSVRRGDKASVENFDYATVQQYIDMAEKAIPSHFDNLVPTIFVATDDCTVMTEFREMRPSWKFVSECDKEHTVGYAGFALTDMKQWSKQDTDAHYAKFLIELYAMATSKYFIGVWYTNVSWWAQFMRGADRTTFLMLDTPKTSTFALDWN
mmetsp:Transcript_27642/g.31562  ORF Transcript_27642/g.31562 Transcript_27642/m.31562 type:complete len:402 (+) Transcript_27642:59-1264(+)